MLERSLISDLHTYTKTRSPKGQMTSYIIYFLYLISNFSPSALLLWCFFVPSHCSHSPCCFKWSAFSRKNSREFWLHLLFSFTVSSITLWTFYFLPVSSLFNDSVCLIFFFTLGCIFHSLISLSLLVSQTQIKPSLQFSGSSHLVYNDPLACLHACYVQL